MSTWFGSRSRAVGFRADAQWALIEHREVWPWRRG